MLFPEQVSTGFMDLETVRAPLGGAAVSYTARKLVIFTLYDANTLEDLLSVKLKQPYVFSSESAGLQPSTIEQLYPADAPGLL